MTPTTALPRPTFSPVERRLRTLAAECGGELAYCTRTADTIADGDISLSHVHYVRVIGWVTGAVVYAKQQGGGWYPNGLPRLTVRGILIATRSHLADSKALTMPASEAHERAGALVEGEKLYVITESTARNWRVAAPVRQAFATLAAMRERAKGERETHNAAHTALANRLAFALGAPSYDARPFYPNGENRAYGIIISATMATELLAMLAAARTEAV